MRFKSSKFLGVSILALATVFMTQGCGTFGAKPVDNGQTALIQEVNGQAEMKLDEGEWETAMKAVKLRAGDELRTRENSIVTLQLGENGGSLDLQENSVLKIVQIGGTLDTPEPGAIVELKKGRVTGDTKNPTKAKVQVRTPRGNFVID
jgi:hypothetical protein